MLAVWGAGYLYQPLHQDFILYTALAILGLIILPFFLMGLLLKFRRKRRIKKGGCSKVSESSSNQATVVDQKINEHTEAVVETVLEEVE